MEGGMAGSKMEMGFHFDPSRGALEIIMNSANDAQIQKATFVVVDNG